jgi:hypothetical protein
MLSSMAVFACIAPELGKAITPERLVLVILLFVQLLGTCGESIRTSGRSFGLSAAANVLASAPTVERRGERLTTTPGGEKMIRCICTLLTGLASIWLVASAPAAAAAETNAGARMLSTRQELADLRLPKTIRRDKLFAGCLKRLHSSDKQIEYRTISGGRVKMTMEGGRLTSASNGRQTATAVYKGGDATEVRLSDGRTFEVRQKMTDEERANLPEKFNRMNRHVARVLARGCNLGISVGEIEAGLKRVSDGGDDYPGDWDSAYETQEFFQLYWEMEFDLSLFPD